MASLNLALGNCSDSLDSSHIWPRRALVEWDGWVHPLLEAGAMCVELLLVVILE